MVSVQTKTVGDSLNLGTNALYEGHIPSMLFFSDCIFFSSLLLLFLL